MYVANYLAKAGYFGGNPCDILNSPCNIVIDTFYYEIFTRDFENAFNELNRKEIK